MAISRIEIRDFFVFKGEFTAEFCAGVNVLTGGNGTGKTTLLRMMYGKSNHFVFGNPGAKFDIYVNNTLFSQLSPTVKNDTVCYISDSELVNTVFIPESNILSHARGLLETVKYGKLHYEMREVEIIEKARVLPNKPKSKTVEEIENIIGGTIELSADGQTFFINKTQLNYSIDLLFEASGYQKLALLARLIHNEQIKPGSILFWDEPENSLNPELIPVLVDILLELSRNGVQIFIATHSEILASYFSVNQQHGDSVMFYSLYKEQEQIKVDANDRFDLLYPNKLTEEPVKLYEKQIEKGLGNG